MKPPFEIYHTGLEIADAEGHLCTAESPEIAKEILAALSAHCDAKPVAWRQESMGSGKGWYYDEKPWSADAQPLYAAPQVPGVAQPTLDRNFLAETIHKARWPKDRQLDITPFADEDRSGREYCFRIADAVLAAQPPAAPVETDDLVKRLRTKHVYGAFEIEQQRQDAANEIERLTADYNEMRAAHDKLVSRSSAETSEPRGQAHRDAISPSGGQMFNAESSGQEG